MPGTRPGMTGEIVESRGAFGMDILLAISRETFRGRGHTRIFGEMIGIGRVVVRQSQWPGAVFSDRDALDVETRAVCRQRARDRRADCRREFFRPSRWSSSAACAMVASSRCRPIQTLPKRSAIGACSSATSGLIAGNKTIGSLVPNGLSITFQSSRYLKTSEPINPRSGMNGTPFSAACKAACSAGHVASSILIAPEVTAAVKRGAGPNSPRLTALVSRVAIQPAPISRSACKLEVGRATKCSRLTRRRISARVASIGTPETSRGTTTMQPSVTAASASSRDFAG